MKKILMWITICFLLMTAQHVSAEMIVTSVSSKTISVDISISSDVEQSFATVAVMPYGKDAGNIEITEGIIRNVFYITKAADENGKLSMTFSLPDVFENGQYCAVSYDNGKKFVSRMGIADESLGAELAGINGADNTAQLQAAIEGLTSFNVYESIFSENKDAICTYVIKHRPASGYTKDGFLKAYFTGEAVCRYSAGEISLHKFMTEYSAYLGIDYRNTFGTLSEKGFKEADRLFSERIKNTDLSIDEILCNVYEIAEIKACTTEAELSQIYIPGAVSRRVDMTKYNKLNSYNKENVFLSLLSKISGANKIEEIDAFFAEAVNKFTPAEKSGPSGGAPNKVQSGVNSYVKTENTGEAETEFSDVSGHWAEKYIKQLSERGVINGFGDKTFKPDNTVTRAEFTKIICKMFNLDKGGECSFKDVKATDWYYESICNAFGAGIITGYENIFNPNGFITREEAAVIICRVLRLNAAGNVSFTDAKDIADYSREAVSALNENGILNGYPDGSFRPKGHISRAEVTSLVIKASEAREN